MLCLTSTSLASPHSRLPECARWCQELGKANNGQNQGWLRSLEGFAARLKWRAHNMQVLELAHLDIGTA